MFYIDPFYILLSLPALLLGTIAQILVKYFYSKYSRIANVSNINGVEVVEKVVKEYGLNIRLNISLNNLEDHYNPINNELTLSENVARMPSIASVGIASHELGHAIQDKNKSILVSMRNYIVPIVNIGSTLGYILFLIGLFFQIFNLVIFGIILFSLSTIFTVITLPIEIDASVKAVNIIRKLGLLHEDEISGVKNVLIAASLTYVASVFQSLTNLLYYVFQALGVRRKRQ